MIGIIDYGLGNLTSVAGAVEKLGFECLVSSAADELAACDKLILPGVGAFGDGMRNLHERGLIEPLSAMVRQSGTPVLGICLGFQLLARSSDEFGDHAGLGWIDARVTRIESNGGSLRVPHVGWNELHQTRDCVMFDGVPDQSLFYYVHSYKLETPGDTVVAGHCDYGQTIVAVIQNGNIFGTQFHPEKSQEFGLRLLGNFLEKA